jgi:RNA polymerase sigma-70 factor (ECF subfamily)
MSIMRNEETTRQVMRAQAGDAEAFNWLVRRFQDRAVAYAASVVGSFHLAQDAAQEAFVEAYGALHTLREPAAFLVWFRRIVFKHCNRQTRRKQVDTVPIQAVEHIRSSTPGLAEIAERHQVEESVHRAIQSLPEGQRAVITLFYMGEQSHQDIAEFLGLPVTTVKSRLHQGRSRLKERLLVMINDNLQEHRPSRDDAFLTRVNEHIAQASAAVTEGGGRETFYHDPHPLYQLMGSLLLWAIEVKASEIRLLAESQGAAVQFDIEGSSERVMSLPQSLQEPMAFRMKVSAEMDVSRTDVPQEGMFPIRYNGADYDALVSSLPTQYGEDIRIRIIPK